MFLASQTFYFLALKLGNLTIEKIWFYFLDCEFFFYPELNGTLKCRENERTSWIPEGIRNSFLYYFIFIFFWMNENLEKKTH